MRGMQHAEPNQDALQKASQGQGFDSPVDQVASRSGRILLAEDDVDLGRVLTDLLTRVGNQVELARTGTEALRLARSEFFDIVILDLGLPEIDGLDILRILREEGHELRVLVLTARERELTLRRSFELGADDYVQKPVSVLELLARIEAHFRRADIDQESNERVFELAPHIQLDLARREVVRDGQRVGLTQREGQVLRYLIRNANRVVSRENLLTDVWGYLNPWVQSRTVDILISSLRKKVEPNPDKPIVIQTVRSAGYRWGL